MLYELSVYDSILYHKIYFTGEIRDYNCVNIGIKRWLYFMKWNGSFPLSGELPQKIAPASYTNARIKKIDIGV